MSEEVWEDIPGFNGCYQASNKGNIKSFMQKRFPLGRILKPNDNQHGYLYVNLSKDGNPKSYQVHKLVAMTFLNHVPDGYNTTVNHKDWNRKNNNLENLNIMSFRENTGYRKAKMEGKYTSKYVGVHFDSIRGKWFSQIIIKGKCIFIGRFNTEEKAYKARVKTEKELLNI